MIKSVSEQTKEAAQVSEEDEVAGATEDDYDQAYAEAAKYSHFQEEYDEDLLNSQAWSQEFGKKM